MHSYLDTNVVLYLHNASTERITPKAQNQINTSDLIVSPMVLLELEMLYEIGRINFNASRILADMSQLIGLAVSRMPMADVISRSLSIKWTRCPGDRIITAHADADHGSPLVSSDKTIKKHYQNTIW